MGAGYIVFAVGVKVGGTTVGTRVPVGAGASVGAQAVRKKNSNAREVLIFIFSARGYCSLPPPGFQYHY